MRSPLTLQVSIIAPVLAVAVMAAAGAPAHAQSSAEVRATVQFVESGGIGVSRDATIASRRAPARGAVAVSGEPGAYVVSSATNQVVAVDASGELRLQGSGDRVLEGTIRQTLHAAGGMQLLTTHAAASVVADAAPDLYRGTYTVVANFN